MNRGIVLVVAMVMALGACAGTKSETREEPRSSGDAEPAVGSDAVTPEQMEAVQEVFKRKEPSVVECYNDELKSGTNKKFEGDVMINLVISREGRATEVKVARTSLNNANVEACILKMIGTWQFPTLSGKLSTSHRYGFKRAF